MSFVLRKNPFLKLLDANNPIPTKLDEISARQFTLGPQPVVGAKYDPVSEAHIEESDPMLAAIRRLQSKMLGIRKALWWTLGFVVAIAVILLLRH